MSTPYIPCLDLGSYINGTEEERKKFSDELGRAFNDSGFVTITNHGLSQELIDKLYENIKAAFSLPVETKRKYEKPELLVNVVTPVQVRKPLKGPKHPI